MARRKGAPTGRSQGCNDMEAADPPRLSCCAGQRRSNPDFLSQLSLRRYFRRLTASDTAAGQVPPTPVRGAHEQQCRTDIDCHDGALILRACEPPPKASRREAKSESGAPRKIDERGAGFNPNSVTLPARYTAARTRAGCAHRL